MGIIDPLPPSRRLRRYHATVAGERLTLLVSPHQHRDETLGIVWSGNDDRGIQNAYSITKLGDPKDAHDELVAQFRTIVEMVSRELGAHASPLPWPIHHALETRLATSTLDDLFRATLEGCRQHIIDHGDLPWIQYALFPSLGEGYPISLTTPTTTAYDKDVLVEIVNAVGNQHRFIGWVNAATAWLAPSTPDLAPSRHPERREILWVAAQELNGANLIEAWAIHREGSRVAALDNLGALGGEGRWEGRLMPTFSWTGHEEYQPITTR